MTLVDESDWHGPMWPETLSDETCLALDSLAYLIENAVLTHAPDLARDTLDLIAVQAVVDVSEAGWGFLHDTWPRFPPEEDTHDTDQVEGH